MSVPKPRVFRANGRWNFECEGCREPKQRGYFDHWTAVRAATDHSRTHTAERIADELDRLFDAYQGVAVFSSDPTRSMFYRGKREGTLDAARLIRTHLV